MLHGMAPSRAGASSFELTEKLLLAEFKMIVVLKHLNSKVYVPEFFFMKPENGAAQAAPTSWTVAVLCKMDPPWLIIKARVGKKGFHHIFIKLSDHNPSHLSLHAG